MSDDLFATRLRWANGSGMAKLRGKAVPLHNPPHIDGLDIVELIYTPEVRVARVLEPLKAWRDLKPWEIKACDQFLRDTVREYGEA